MTAKTKTAPKSLFKREQFQKCAEIFKVMCNAKRLEIMTIIKDKEVTVNEISDLLGTRKSNTSQHLSYLRYVGIVSSRRDGKNIYYKLVDPKIVDACKIVSEIKIKGLLSN